MKCYVLMGSPRKEGNTAQLLQPFIKEMNRNGWDCDVDWLYDKNISPCTACRSCQKDWSVPGCCQQDDMETVFEKVLDCDLLILATPVYSWYCTPPVKAALDRMVYGLNKYYGKERGPSLWAGKKLAIITTCGYPPEKGADLLEEGIKRYCRHSQLQYAGMLVQRHKGYNSVFMDKDKEVQVEAFARGFCADRKA